MNRLSILGALATAAALGAAMPAHACTVTTTLTPDLGSYSPAAVKQSAVAAVSLRAGLLCVPSGITILGTNYIRAKMHSDNGLNLKSGVHLIPYVASADSAGTYRFTQDVNFDYMQNNLLNILGLLSATNADMPLFIKPSSATLMPIGVYTDKIKIDWTWYICQGLMVGSSCTLGPLNQGGGTTTIDLTMTVTPKTITLTTSTSTTWDPINNNSFPKSLPGGRKRLKIEASNPDLVAADNGSLGLSIGVPPKAMIALDGDGTSSTFVQFAEGSPASALALTYTSPSSTSDDVDFSADNGASWTYVPVPGDDVSQSAVTNVRLRMRGAMAAGSNFSVTLPLKTK